MKVLFLLAWISRIALMLMLAHWGLILVTILLGVPIEWAADYTLVVTVGVGIVVFLGLTALNRDGRFSERMSRGPAELLRHSVAVISAAMASSVGAIVLLLHEGGSTALWATGLSTFVAVCETSALLGSMYIGVLESQTTEEDR